MIKEGNDLQSDCKDKAIDYKELNDDRLLGMLAAFKMEDTTIFWQHAFKDSIKNVLEPVKYMQQHYTTVSSNIKFEPVKVFCNLAI